MTEHESCPKCGSNRVIDDVRIVAFEGGHLVAKVQKKPHAKLFKGTVSVPLKARVCGACGYAELYASDPASLLEAQSVADSMFGKP